MKKLIILSLAFITFFSCSPSSKVQTEKVYDTVPVIKYTYIYDTITQVRYINDTQVVEKPLIIPIYDTIGTEEKNWWLHYIDSVSTYLITKAYNLELSREQLNHRLNFVVDSLNNHYDSVRIGLLEQYNYNMFKVDSALQVLSIRQTSINEAVEQLRTDSSLVWEALYAKELELRVVDSTIKKQLRRGNISITPNKGDTLDFSTKIDTVSKEWNIKFY